ncbi:unnamed protein product [Parnassius apollo]|uniref:(apollo) hypothetical protein n=1 Tax=Parnassius apollo TaxID=110799 RepID=A0A8S3Y366_PARAO|nr:unnamed protein product [Parnassius apollo]
MIRSRNDFSWTAYYDIDHDRLWRKTLSRSNYRCFGADPNRNWNYNWGKHSSTHNPCDYQTYAGSRPFSEIETRTLSSYIQNIDNLLVYVSLHSYAAMLLIPFSDSTQHVDNYKDLVRVGRRSIDYGYEVNRAEKYQGPGTAADMLYKASGGSTDWVRHTLNTPLVYTYELRGNSFHWPPSRIQEQGNEVTQMMLGLASEASILGYL